MIAKKQRAVGYCRVSTKEQLEGGSLERQEHLIREHCRIHDFRLLDVICDSDVSGGRKIHLRPGGQRLLYKVDRRLIDRVVTPSLDRLFRSLPDCINEVERWRSRSIVLQCLDLDLDLNTAAGWASFAIRATLADFERRLIGERVKAVMAVLKAQGVPLGSPPFGWTRTSRRDQHGRLEWAPNVEELRALVLMCEMRAAGATLQAICDRLVDDEVPTKRGGVWRPSTVWWAMKRFAGRTLQPPSPCIAPASSPHPA